MPIKIQKELPAFKVLSDEKIQAENQILRYLSNTPLQVEITLLNTKTYQSHNTPLEHLNKFYSHFEDIKDQKFDGLVITGAPVEQMPFEDVKYYKELTEIMEWSKTNVYSTLHICWGAQVGLYYHYGIPKYPLKQKMFGVFTHNVIDEKAEITRGLDDCFYAPHSRHTEVRREDIEKVKGIRILSESKEAGVFIVASDDNRKIFITGHLEYDRDTLKDEYFRDKEKGLPINIPKNYFPNGDTSKKPTMRWRGSAHIVFANWLNYCVYQNTPFDLQEIK